MTKQNEYSDILSEIPHEISILPINDGVIFPFMLVPLVVTDERLVGLVDEALAGDKIIGVCTQVDADVSDPEEDDLYQTGCALLIQKMARFPDGQVRIIGQGLARIEIRHFTQREPFMRARIKLLREQERKSDKAKALIRNTVDAFTRLVEMSEGYPEEIRGVVANIRDAGRLADMVASNLNLEVSEKQQVLEVLSPLKRLQYVYELLNNELEIVRIGEEIKRGARQEMDREHREYYLRQQIKAIQKELGEEDSTVELEEVRGLIETTPMPEKTKEAALKEWSRLQKMSSSSAEYTVARTYLDWLLELPWERSVEDMLDIRRAKKILDQDHYDLEQVKERILEFLSVKKLRSSTKGSILCFVGPPGVGKTSLGMSIARALGRRFVRISLGGVKDEAEIRGHRRTYIGALPGRIIQGIRTAGSNNPVFMLDEIDKLGSDFRGDPSAALLEVLDPEQNNTFEDHYINLPFDLSRVMFITTANVRETIPKPLLDRMEVLELPGYITSEKVQIAARFLIPRQLQENGITQGALTITDDATRAIIERYTREAGVRNLERRVASISRRIARKLVEGKRGPYRVSSRNLKSYLGPLDYPEQEMLSRPELGVSTGMARTAAGGVMLFIEALKMRGRGRLKLTGQLGDIMKESAEAALSYVKSHYGSELAEERFFERYDIHLHIPEGAVPKDGPSAGIAIAVALASIALGRKVRNDIAMTGEVTLTGKILPVGGVKEKVIAAHRAGIRTIILPVHNRKDLEEIPSIIKKDLQFHFIGRINEGLNHALVSERRPSRKKRKRAYARV